MGWESGGMVEFEIERGNLGATQVVFSRIVDGEHIVVDTLI
jgi:hypothetical protein